MSEEKAGGIEKLGLPVVLLSAIWGALDVILKSIEIKNKIRDLAIKAPTLDERTHVFWSDWMWLWLGTCWFLLLFTVVIFHIPKFLTSSATHYGFQRRLCLLAATVPGFAFLGVLIGGGMDIPLFFK